MFINSLNLQQHFIQRYSIADNPYSIGSDSNPDTLNSILKSIIREDSSDSNLEDYLEQTEFDFYVNGTFLDSTIDSVLKSRPEIKVVSINQILITNYLNINLFC